MRAYKHILCVPQLANEMNTLLFPCVVETSHTSHSLFFQESEDDLEKQGKSRTTTKAALAKKLLRKNIKANQKVVFSDDDQDESVRTQLP